MFRRRASTKVTDRGPKPGWILCLALLAILPFQSVAATPLSRVAATVKVPILAYHYISPNPPPTPPAIPEYPSYFLTPDRFSAELDAIQALGYTTIGLEDLLNYRNDPGQYPLPEKPVIITFDDGEQGVYRYAYPALNSRGMKATFFVITDYIRDSDADRCTTDNWDHLASCQLIWPEVLEMYQNGMEIGSHTKSHPANLIDLNASDPGAAADEIRGSKTVIESHLGSGAVRFFAYPHGIGAGDPGVEALVGPESYQAAVAFDPNDDPVDPLSGTLDIYALQRVAVYREHTLELNVSDPWNFFVRRLDPTFPLPDLADTTIGIEDSEGQARTRFYPGEAITLSVQAANWDQATDVAARLQLIRDEEPVYDSHLANPVADQTARPFPGVVGDQAGNHTFQFGWVIPPAPGGAGSYNVRLFFTDLSGLLTYAQSAFTGVFDVVSQLPISVTASPPQFGLVAGDLLRLTFTVSSQDPTGNAYLSVSFSEHLEVVDSTAPSGTWTRYVPGSTLKKKDGAWLAPNPYLMYEMHDPAFNAGTQTYTLTVKALPGISSQDWVKYRLSVKPGASEYFLRAPLDGGIDQQGYFAYRINGDGPLRLYLPIVSQ